MKATTLRPDHDHALSEIDELIRSHGLRRTPQRQATLEAVAAAGGHATAEEIVQRVPREIPPGSPSTADRTPASAPGGGILRHAHPRTPADGHHAGTARLP